MMLLGLPFAFAIGRRGSLYGVGISIAVAAIYFTTLVVASHLAQLFVTRFERDRPPLAAMALAAQPTAQLRALGLPGDVLLLIDDGEGDCEPVILAAQAKDMTLVVLAGRGAAALNELLAETDVLIKVPTERQARVVELQLLVLHCLCDAVDFQLMGEQET